MATYSTSKIQRIQRYISDVATQTFYTVRSDLINGVTKYHPFWDKLESMGMVKGALPVGDHFQVPFRYGKRTNNIQRFAGGSVEFSSDTDETKTWMKFAPKNIGTNMVREWEREKNNVAPIKLRDYVKDLITETNDDLKEEMSVDLLVQNPDPNAITAVPTVINSTPTSGTHGTLTRSLHSALQNVAIDFTGKTTEASLLTSMTTAFNRVSMWKFGARRTPDIILTTRAIYEDYEKIARALRMLETNTSDRADLGFGSLMFKGAEVFWDEDCPSGCMFLLNSTSWEYLYDKRYWFEMTDWKSVPNKLDMMAQILCISQLVCNFPAKNALIHSITSTTNP